MLHIIIENHVVHDAINRMVTASRVSRSKTNGYGEKIRLS